MLTVLERRYSQAENITAPRQREKVKALKGWKIEFGGWGENACLLIVGLQVYWSFFKSRDDFIKWV